MILLICNFLCQIHSLDVVLEDVDIVKALSEYISYAGVEDLVLGSPSRHGFMRYVPSCLSYIET